MSDTFIFLKFNDERNGEMNIDGKTRLEILRVLNDSKVEISSKV